MVVLINENSDRNIIGRKLLNVSIKNTSEHAKKLLFHWISFIHHLKSKSVLINQSTMHWMVFFGQHRSICPIRFDFLFTNIWNVHLAIDFTICVFILLKLFIQIHICSPFVLLSHCTYQKGVVCYYFMSKYRNINYLT